MASFKLEPELLASDGMIQDGDIGWYKIDSVLKNKNKFNFYITTDFATSTQSQSPTLL
jgi:hypothetical protein